MNILKSIILVIYLFPWNCTQLSAVTISDVDIIKKYPHDNTAFTQGLEFHEGRIYESTGTVSYTHLTLPTILLV